MNTRIYFRIGCSSMAYYKHNNSQKTNACNQTKKLLLIISPHQYQRPPFSLLTSISIPYRKKILHTTKLLFSYILHNILQNINYIGVIYFKFIKSFFIIHYFSIVNLKILKKNADNPFPTACFLFYGTVFSGKRL